MVEENRISRIINSAPSPAGGSGGSPPPPSPGSSPAGPRPSGSNPSAPQPSAPPAPPSVSPSGGAGGQVQSEPGAIAEIGRKLTESLGPKLLQAAQEIGSLNLAEASFTAVTVPLAAAYTESSAFFIANLKSKNDRLQEYQYKLQRTADNWRQANDASTVRER